MCVFGTPCGIRTHTVWDLNPMPLPIGLREHGTKFNDIDLASYYIPQHLVSWVMRPSQSGGRSGIRTHESISLLTQKFSRLRAYDQTCAPYHVASSKPFLAWLWWIWQGSNLLRLALQANALPVELQIQMVGASGLEPVSVDYKSTALTN